MTNVSVTDNKCSPVTFVSGDTNENGLLDPGETWTYTCTTDVPVSTLNTATALGSANGFTAIGYAFATVLVAAPSLPNTGYPPETDTIPWKVIVLAGLVLTLVSASLILFFKKQKA